MQDDIRSVFDGSGQVATSTKSVVYDQWNARLVSHFGNGFKVRDVEGRVANGFHVHSLGAIVNQLADGFGVITIGKTNGNSQARERDFELIVSTTVQEAGGNCSCVCARERE